MIQNIWAVGRNYADHAKELGNTVPTAPLIFLKAGSCAVFSEEVRLPSWTEDVHHEIELALKLDSQLEIASVGLALDLTERKKQSELKSQGQPWTLAKSFQNACPISAFKAVDSSVDWKEFHIELYVNGEKRQAGSSSLMIFQVPVLLKFIRDHFPVVEGDVILTGTPAGVGPLKSQDRLQGILSYKNEVLIEKSWLISK